MKRDSKELPFYGRDKELLLLAELKNDVLEKGKSRFAVISGRQGVGKTRLIEEAIPHSAELPVIRFLASAQLGQTNLRNFSQEVADALELSFVPSLESFAHGLDLVLKEVHKRPIALVLDEFQNFSSVDPSFFDSLKKVWKENRHKSRILLICACTGSNQMREIFRNEKSPLFGAADAFIQLPPFSPQQMKAILKGFTPNFSGEDLLALYAFTGGVPKYVKAFLEARAFTFSAMLKEAIRSNSWFLTEAQLLIADTLKGNAAVMNELLMAISNGKTKRHELTSLFPIDISGHLHQLENVFGLLEKAEPVGQNGAIRKRATYEISDEMLGFWYSFCLPNLQLLQCSRTRELQRIIEEAYPARSEEILKKLYRGYFADLNIFTNVGAWQDKKGENEIDCVCIDEVSQRIFFFDINRQSESFSPEALKVRAEEFFRFNPKFKSFQRDFGCLSLRELSASDSMPFEDTLAQN